MGLLERVSTLVRANLNDLLERAEDPEKVVKQLIIDMNNQCIQVRTQVATAIADERKLQRLWEQNDLRANEWQGRAEKAVRSGNDDAAKQCLGRAITYRELADGFHRQQAAQMEQAEALTEAFHQLEAKMQAAEARKDLLIARSRQARARARLQEATTRANGVSALSEFHRLEERVQEQEARAEALVELDADTLEAKLQQMEQEEELETRLLELKAQIGMGGAEPPPIVAVAGR